MALREQNIAAFICEVVDALQDRRSLYHQSLILLQENNIPLIWSSSSEGVHNGRNELTVMIKVKPECIKEAKNLIEENLNMLETLERYSISLARNFLVKIPNKTIIFDNLKKIVEQKTAIRQFVFENTHMENLCAE